MMIYFNDYDWIGNTEGGGGPLKPLVEMVQDLGNSVYTLILTVGIVALVIAIALFFVKMFAGGQQAREKGKVDLVWILIGGIGLFSIIGIVFSLIRIGETINDEMRNVKVVEEEATTEACLPDGILNPEILL